MAVSFGRDALLDAFDQIGTAAVRAGVRLEIAVYGGSALMLASNFRFATEDVDIAAIEHPWPQWLADVVERVADDRGWGADWLNDAVAFHLSPLADRASDHVEFATFPRITGEPGLAVIVPTPGYLLALKLKASRFTETGKGENEISDVLNLMKVLGISQAEEAIAIMARYFPRSGDDPVKQRFLLNYFLSEAEPDDAPEYPRIGV